MLNPLLSKHNPAEWVRGPFECWQGYRDQIKSLARSQINNVVHNLLLDCIEDPLLDALECLFPVGV